MRDWNPWQELYCVVKDNGEFAGVPCLSYEEAQELSYQHEGSMIFKMTYDNNDPFGFRFKKEDSQMLTDYLFFDNESEGFFFVECETYTDACEVVSKYFNPDEVKCVDECTPEEAELMGYDTY